MNPTARYFRNIRDAIVTTARGMRVTLRYWVREPAITVEYPDRLPPGTTKEDLVSPRWRGHLGLIADLCTGCAQCMRACPIDCIRVASERREAGRWLTAFDVNLARCMYCGLCVEACPTGAVAFTRRYEGATARLDDLYERHLVSPVPAARPGAARAETARP